MNATSAVSIGQDCYIIDTDAWIAQRVGPVAEDDTAALRDFTNHPLWSHPAAGPDLATRVQLWCAARDWFLSESVSLRHEDTALSRPVTIVLATAPDPAPHAVAVIIDDQQVSVYPDRTVDDGTWYQANTIDLVCPSRHRHTWLGEGEAIDSDGNYTTIRSLFGPDPHAPYRRCRACEAYETDPTWLLPCGCGDVSAIYCPRCGDRCHLQLPTVETYPPTGGPA